MNLDAKIEAILFWKGEPVSLKKLADIFSVEIKDIESALAILDKRLIDTASGISLVKLNDEVELMSNKTASEYIEKITKDEIMRDLGKAGLETLSIILYKSPISRADIDYIRGVNSQFILRNLLIRGLIERITNPADSRSYVYKPTFNLLSHLGIKSIDELPEFSRIKEEIEKIEKDDEQISGTGNEGVAENITENNLENKEEVNNNEVK